MVADKEDVLRVANWAEEQGIVSQNLNFEQMASRDSRAIEKDTAAEGTRGEGQATEAESR